MIAPSDLLRCYQIISRLFVCFAVGVSHWVHYLRGACSRRVGRCVFDVWHCRAWASPLCPVCAELLFSSIMANWYDTTDDAVIPMTIPSVLAKYRESLDNGVVSSFLPAVRRQFTSIGYQLRAYLSPAYGVATI